METGVGVGFSRPGEVRLKPDPTTDNDFETRTRGERVDDHHEDGASPTHFSKRARCHAGPAAPRCHDAGVRRALEERLRRWRGPAYGVLLRTERHVSAELPSDESRT